MRTPSWSLLLSVLVVVAGCGSAGTSVDGPGVAELAFDSPGPVAFSDVDQSFWVVDTRSNGSVLVRIDRDGSRSETTLEPDGAAEPFGARLVPHGADMVLARVVCDGAACGVARLRVEAFGSRDGDVVERGEAFLSEPIGYPGGVQFAGTPDGRITFRSDDVLVLRSGADAREMAVPVGVAPICVVGDHLVGAQYPVPEDLAGSEEPDVPVPGDIGTGRLVDLDGQAVRPLPDAEFEYSIADQLEPRCSAEGLEVAVPGRAAALLWDGSGAWREGSGRDRGWRVAPSEPGDLVGVVGDQVVRVDSLTGEIIERTAIPSAVLRAWEERGEREPLTPSVVRARGRESRAAICSFSPGGDDRRASCVVFG